VDLSEANDDQLVLQEITVEDYLDGQGQNARQVRRTKFKLADKQGAIERLNKMFGLDRRQERGGRGGRIRALTDEELHDALVEQMVARGMEELQARTLLAARRGSPQSPEHRRGAGCRPWQLRASTSLARLRRGQGRHAEARDIPGIG
jgi:hypothetical protein